MYFHFTSVLARLATERELRGNHAITSFALTQRFLSSRMRLRLLSVPCARLSIAVGFILNLRVNAVVLLLLAVEFHETLISNHADIAYFQGSTLTVVNWTLASKNLALACKSSETLEETLDFRFQIN